MLFQPAIIALLLGSALVTAMLLYSSFYGVLILKQWDIRSGTERQLGLERRTYLISTLMTYAFGFQLLSLFLFIYTADKLSSLFVGAMCAAGTLNVDPWGYPAIGLKIVNFLLGGLWLIINFTDNRAHDYPLIKKKYGLLLLIAPLIIAESVLLWGYFLRIKPAVITSCCGALFTSESGGFTSGMIALPRTPLEVLFYISMAFMFFLGIRVYLKGRGGYLFSAAGIIAFLVSAGAFISFICLYVYEMPVHHCPFCILQKEYGYVGYPIYIALLGGTILVTGVGMLRSFENIDSLKLILPSIQEKLTLSSLFLYTVFIVIVFYELIFSNLKM